jgi:hypothetical protein
MKEAVFPKKDPQFYLKRDSKIRPRRASLWEITKIRDSEQTIMKTYNYRSHSALILMTAFLFLSVYAATQATSASAQSYRGAAGRPAFERSVNGSARLIVHRIPGLGNHLVVNLWIDGMTAPSIMYGQTYEALLAPGRHVLSVLATPHPRWPTPTRMILDVRSGETYNFTAMSDDSGNLILQAPGGPVRPRGR